MKKLLLLVAIFSWLYFDVAYAKEYVYVTNRGDNTVSVLNSDLVLLDTINVGNSPYIPAIVDVSTVREIASVINAQSDNDLDKIPNNIDVCPISDLNGVGALDNQCVPR